jgi:serine/threonine protein kinase
MHRGMSASAREDVLGADRFVLKGRIGGGAMGEVFRAHDRERGVDVALKMLRDPEPQKIYRFKREFRALADVAHPNLVRLHELVSSGDRWFFTMELVDGIDFLSWVRGEGEGGPREDETPTGDVDPASVPSSEPEWPTVTSEVGSTAKAAPRRRRTSQSTASSVSAMASPTAPVLRIASPLLTDDQWQRLREGVRQLAVGVQALHDHGTLHRDIKPSNVMVARDGRVVLLDFGIISELSRPTAADAAGLLFGTPAYMAPEIGSRRALDAAADWYAVGVMLYEAMAGRRPFHAPVAELLEMKRLREPPPVRELAVSPPPDLEDLCTELLARDPAARPAGADILARLGARRGAAAPARPAVDAPLVGRDVHLASLRAAYGAVLSGEPRVVLISGPSGVGKSTLVSRFLAEVNAEGQAMIVAGRCYERESVPFKAVDDLVDNLCQRLAALPKQEVMGLLPRRVASLARLFPVLEQIDAVRNAPRRLVEPTDPHEQRRVAFAALRELLVRLSARRPLVLHIDDGQWGDDDSAALLAEVFRAPYAPPALLVVNYRETEDMGRFVERLRDVDRGHVDLAVGDLSFDDARTLADVVLAEGGAPRRFAEAIARESGGNPLFVTELARYVVGGADAERLVSLEDIVRARVGELPAGARRLLELLAVAAWAVPRPIAIAAAAVDDEAQTIEALLAARLVHVRTLPGGDLLETFHDRVRAAVVAQVPAAALPDIHRRLAAAMDQGDGQLVDHLAVHLDLAGDAEGAGPCYRRAADAAASKLAFGRAALMYARAIELLHPTGAARAEIYAHMAEAFQNAGKGVESAAAYMAAATGVDRIRSLRYRGQAGQQLLRAGHIDEGVAAIRDVLAEVGIRMPRSRLRAMVSLLGHRLQVRWGRLRYVERSADAVSVEQLTKIDVCWTASVAFGMSDTMAGALFQARHVLESLRAGEPHHVSHALAIEGVYRSLVGVRAMREVDAIQGRARDLADRTGDPLSIAWATGAHSLTRYQVGHWRRSCESAAHSLAAMEGRAGMWFERATVEMYRLWSLYWMGHFRELAERTSALRSQALDLGDLYSATSLSIGLPAVQWLVRDRADDGRRAADEAMAGWSRQTYHLQHHWHAYAIAHVDMYQGRPLVAWELLRTAARNARRAFLTNLQMIRIELDWSRGRAALLAVAQGEGDRDGLLRDARRAARALRKEKRGDAEALALTLEAALAAQGGDAALAIPKLTAATDRASEQELYFLAELTRAARGRLLGGERGDAMVREAAAWMTEQNIADPAALGRIFLPGF